MEGETVSSTERISWQFFLAKIPSPMYIYMGKFFKKLKKVVPLNVLAFYSSLYQLLDLAQIGSI